MEVYRGLDHPACEAGQALDARLAATDGPVLLMLSGGSSLQTLAEVLPERFTSDVTITVLDERVTDDPTLTNFGQLAETGFYKRAQQGGVHTIDPRVAGGSAQYRAAWFHDAITQWRTDHPNGVIIATQGVGADGHTAGIFPHPDDPDTFHSRFVATDASVVGYTVPTGSTKLPERVTVTIPFLHAAVAHSIVLLEGQAKEEALAAIVQDTGTYAATPARVLREMRSVRIYTDLE